MAVAATSATTGTSINVSSIVSQLMLVEQQPITVLNAKEADYQSQLTAYGTVSGAVSNFQTAVATLNNAANTQVLSASSSDTSVFTATAANTAAAGVYGIDITALAQAQRLVAIGQTSQTATIGSGATTTLTFDTGTISGGTLSGGAYTGAAFASNGTGIKAITIDSTNNTLQGIRDAINKANIGISATIINDGSSTPYRLVLSSNSTGQANSMKISVAGDAALNTLLAQDPAGMQNLSEVSTAQNASLKINGIALTKASNTVSDAITGVTLNLSKVTTATTNLTIAPNNNSITSAVTAFVKAYNDLNTTLNNVSSYDASTQTAAVLQGDATVNTIRAQVRSVLTSSISGASGTLTTLSQVGVAFQKDGTLALDTTKLSSALASGSANVASLFGSIGTTTDSLISYSAASNNTPAGTYGINITQLATQGNALGTTAVAASTVITPGTNDTLNLTVNGVSASITLAGGTYTPQQLATALQGQINGAAGLSAAGIKVTTSIDPSGMLSISTNAYGSTNSVAINSGSAIASLFGATAITQTAGLDVAGTIGDVPATGVGQVLTAGNGLVVNINGGALGIRGTVSYSQGYATKLTGLTSSLLDSKGLIAGRTNGINTSIKDITNQVTELQAGLAQKQAAYLAEYSALDVMLTNMNQTSIYLTQQLANLP